MISSLATLMPLESLIHLQHLVLLGNPVTEQEHYKEFVVWKVGGRLRSRRDLRPFVARIKATGRQY